MCAGEVHGRITHVQGRCMGGSHVSMGSTWEDHVCAWEVHGRITHVHGKYMGGSHVQGGAWEDHACAGEELTGPILYTTIKQRWEGLLPSPFFIPKFL